MSTQKTAEALYDTGKFAELCAYAVVVGADNERLERANASLAAENKRMRDAWQYVDFEQIVALRERAKKAEAALMKIAKLTDPSEYGDGKDLGCDFQGAYSAVIRQARSATEGKQND